jgi:AcrR family transcriptional regulator
MGVKERREREKNELRTRIMDAARTIFADEGYDAVSMRRIADAIEYSPAAIYAYFKDKAELFRQIVAEDFEDFGRRFSAAGPIADPIERIWLAGHAYLSFAIGYPSHYRLMFMQGCPIALMQTELTEEEKRRMGDPDTDSYAYLRVACAEAIDAHRLRPGLTDPDLVAQTLWAAVHGVASTHITHGNDPWIQMRPVDQRAALILETTLRGLMRRPMDLDDVIRRNAHRVRDLTATAPSHQTSNGGAAS